MNARRSRSVGVAKKRKREASVVPTSRTRSQSASRPPRDQSGVRDPKVCGVGYARSSCHQVKWFVLKICTMHIGEVLVPFGKC